MTVGTWLMFAATTGAFIAAAIYAHWAHITYDEIVKQTPKIAEAGDAASDSVKQAKTSFRLDERGWLAIGMVAAPVFAPNSFINIPTKAENLGKTPVLNVNAVISLSSVSDKEALDLSLKYHSGTLSIPVLFPGMSQPPISVRMNYKGFPISINDTTFQEFRGGHRVLVYYGRATYRDVFDAEHCMKFCEVIPYNQNQSLAAPLIAAEKACIAYNGIDPIETPSH